MTDKEEKLLDIAMLQISKNEGCSLSGSLSLAVRGVVKRRDAHDIDIVTRNPESFVPYPIGEWVKLPSGGYPKQKYRHIFSELEIDVLHSNEAVSVINGIPCATVHGIIFAKAFYGYIQDIEKHRLDLEYLYSKNPVLFIKLFPVMAYLTSKELILSAIRSNQKNNTTLGEIFE